ncbi:hypothetical protein ACQJBY_010877 [Aegilops geniculata]|uniref:uncharacterized protein n=1 Tax=Aegilops tauschii subsp. strangulata TaxID=200361 RepID=UPI0003D46AA4|nr:uncharacterized protein LOC109759768 [Aegilops tauschii subsp. strangulata]XP_044333535.1 uncharacterized protein LOC123053972 [Triticum aestivum]
MHLWPSLRIRDSFKHAYLEKLEFNLANKKRAQGQGQGRQGQDGDEQQAPLLEGRSSSMVATAVELACDAAMLLSCCCCCFCCGACGGEEDDPLTAR